METSADTARTWRIAGLVLALVLVALATWANAIAARPATLCPAEGGAFSCAALVRPALSMLGPTPIARLVLLGAATEALAALLLVARGARLPFARDAAVLAASGAGLALGLQALAVLGAGRACLACLLVLACQAGLALVLAKVAKDAGAKRLPLVVAFAVALLGAGALATSRGLALRRHDDDARAALARVEREAGRVVLVERPGCPFCEALRLDVLARPEVLARLAKTGLARRRSSSRGTRPAESSREPSGTARTRRSSRPCSRPRSAELHRERHAPRWLPTRLGGDASSRETRPHPSPPNTPTPGALEK